MSAIEPSVEESPGFTYRAYIPDSLFAALVGVFIGGLILLAFWGWTSGSFSPSGLAMVWLLIIIFSVCLLCDLRMAQKRFVVSGRGVEEYLGSRQKRFLPWSEIADIRAYFEESFVFKTGGGQVMAVRVRKKEHFAVLEDDLRKFHPVTRYRATGLAPNFAKLFNARYYWFVGTCIVAALGALLTLELQPDIIVAAGIVAGCVSSFMIYLHHKRRIDKSIFSSGNAVGVIVVIWYFTGMAVNDYAFDADHGSAFRHLGILVWFFIELASLFLAGLLLTWIAFHRQIAPLFEMIEPVQA